MARAYRHRDRCNIVCAYLARRIISKHRESAVHTDACFASADEFTASRARPLLRTARCFHAFTLEGANALPLNPSPRVAIRLPGFPVTARDRKFGSSWQPMHRTFFPHPTSKKKKKTAVHLRETSLLSLPSSPDQPSNAIVTSSLKLSRMSVARDNCSMNKHEFRLLLIKFIINVFKTGIE